MSCLRLRRKKWSGKADRSIGKDDYLRLLYLQKTLNFFQIHRLCSASERTSFVQDLCRISVAGSKSIVEQVAWVHRLASKTKEESCVAQNCDELMDLVQMRGKIRIGNAGGCRCEITKIEGDRRRKEKTTQAEGPLSILSSSFLRLGVSEKRARTRLANSLGAQSTKAPASVNKKSMSTSEPGLEARGEVRKKRRKSRVRMTRAEMKDLRKKRLTGQDFRKIRSLEPTWNKESYCSLL